MGESERVPLLQRIGYMESVPARDAAVKSSTPPDLAGDDARHKYQFTVGA